MWTIREGYGDRMGYRSERCPMKYDDPELQEAYECGWEDHEEMMGEESMGERGGRGGSYMGQRTVGGMDTGGYGERRRRDSMGRYR